MSVVGFEFWFDGGGLGLHHQFDLKVDRKNPPPWGVSYLLCSLIKNREEEDPSWRTTPKIDQFSKLIN